MRSLVLLALAAGLASPLVAQDVTSLDIPGLEQAVEIRRDRWGINHITAESEHDLFFAQGWAAARDRLFQLELWRRQATGTVADWLGPRELQRDIGARLFRFRGDLEAELNHYHPRGAAIVRAFTDGINAYVDLANASPSTLPVEFQLLNTRPQRWTPDVVISRHQGLLGNLTQELSVGRAVAALGADRVKYLDDFAPGNPDLTLAAGIDSALLSSDILALYNAFRASVRFVPDDILASARGRGAAGEVLDPSFDVALDALLGAPLDAASDAPLWSHAELDIGSNNWAVSGRLSESGFPMLANDPHRAQASPSLRYWVHLQAPGWNVIGGGEPVLPGISIGHNEHGAWGLTIFATDGEDLVVYDTDPSNPEQYRYQGNWERMRTIVDTIPVKGRAPEIVTHRYTRHGPVVYRDTERHRAFAVRAAWMEIGGAPYLASLRMDQARTWEEFRDANRYAHIPGENMLWADRTGTIGWQAVGIAPRRRNFSGLVPVPGDGRENGRYEWDGFLDILDKPHDVNPTNGFLATANNDLIPRDYPFMDAVGYVWSDPYRFARISEVLGSGKLQSVSDMMQLQTDELALPARQLVPLLRELRAPTPRLDSLRMRLLSWDRVLNRESVEAGLYAEWESQLRSMVYRAVVRPSERSVVRSVPLRNVVRWLVIPPAELGASPMAARDTMLLQALAAAETELRGRFGERVDDWQYGRPGYKHALIRHALSAAVDSATRARLDVGPMPRGGYAVTVNATGNGDNQTSGASFRLIVDLADWDRAVGMNTPGQSGDPANPHYRDLFTPWSRDQFFPVVFSRSQVEQATESIVRLRAAGR